MEIMKIMPDKPIDLYRGYMNKSGFVEECYAMLNGERKIIRANTTPFKQEPFNCMIAAALAERLNISHVNYSLCTYKKELCCIYDDFETEDLKFYSALELFWIKPPHNEELYNHYISICKYVGINNIVEEVDKMIVLNYLIDKRRGHLKSFGLMRNVKTKKFVCTAPLFDFAKSLEFCKLPKDFGEHKHLSSFALSHEEELKYVSNFEWIDFEKLVGFEDEIYEIFGLFELPHIDDERKKAVADYLIGRIETLKKYAENN